MVYTLKYRLRLALGVLFAVLLFINTFATSISKDNNFDIMGLNTIWPYGKTFFSKKVKNNSNTTIFLKARLYAVHFSKPDARGKETDTPLSLKQQLNSISLLTPKVVIPPHQVGYFRMVMPKGYIKTPDDSYFRLSISNDVAAQQRTLKIDQRNTSSLGFQVSLGYMIALIVPGSNPHYGYVQVRKINNNVFIINNDNTVIPVDFAGTCKNSSAKDKLCGRKGYFSIEHLIYPHTRQHYSLTNIDKELRIIIYENNHKTHKFID